LYFSGLTPHTSHLTPHTSHFFRRREDDKNGVFKAGASNAADSAADVAADAAAAVASDGSSSSVAESAIPFRTCADAQEIDYSVVRGLLQRQQ
jgi:hypothetical protein